MMVFSTERQKINELSETLRTELDRLVEQFHAQLTDALQGITDLEAALVELVAEQNADGVYFPADAETLYRPMTDEGVTEFAAMLPHSAHLLLEACGS